MTAPSPIYDFEQSWRSSINLYAYPSESHDIQIYVLHNVRNFNYFNLSYLSQLSTYLHVIIPYLTLHMTCDTL